MKKKVNLASTETITKSQLNRIMSGVLVSVIKKSTLANKKLDKAIQTEIKNATKRFGK